MTALGIEVTKIHPPARRPELVARPELLTLLRAGAGRRLTLVAAPPGFGKTTAVAAWAQEWKDPVAWLSLDADDSDPARFWAGALGALGSAVPGLGAGAAHLLTGGPPVFIPALVNELSGLEQHLLLVLDDFHTIEGTAVADSLERFVERLPPSVHLALITRSDPPLPLARWRTRGHLAELRSSDLRFSEAETAAVLDGLDLAAATISDLHHRTEGWPAAVYLAALSLRARKPWERPTFVADFAGDERHLVDYLVSEVLDGLPEQTRSFLLRTSILERLCAPLCGAVTGEPGAAERLAELERSNLFLIALDSRREWYRYHHLFGELLRWELERLEPGNAPELHRRAAAWLQAAGMPAAGIQHAVAASDAATAQALVAEHWRATLDEGRHETVDRWLNQLDPAVVRGDPRLSLARGWANLWLGRLEDVVPWADDSADGAMLRALHGLAVGDVSGALAQARVAASDERDVVHGHAEGVPLSWTDERDRAEQVLARGVAELEVPVHPLPAISWRAALGRLRAEAGDDAASTEALRIASAHGLADHAATAAAHAARARALEVQGRHDAALRCARRGGDVAGPGAGRLERAYTFAMLARLEHAEGGREAARAALRRARAELEGAPDPGVAPAVVASVERALGAVKPHEPGEALSDRELDVLRLLATDKTRREIGEALYVSLDTVKSHMKSIFRKLDAASRGEAVERARAQGLI